MGRLITIKLTPAQARELRNSIEGWMDAGSLAPGDKDEGIVGTERDALQEAIDQINKGLYS